MCIDLIIPIDHHFTKFWYFIFPVVVSLIITLLQKKNLSSKFWNIISLKFIWIFFSRLSQTFYFCWILLFDFEIYIKYNLNTHLGIYSTSIDENNTFWFCLTSYLTIYLISLRILFYFVLKKIKTLEYFE